MSTYYEFWPIGITVDLSLTKVIKLTKEKTGGNKNDISKI
jgi:hypothetical protein